MSSVELKASIERFDLRAAGDPRPGGGEVTSSEILRTVRSRLSLWPKYCRIFSTAPMGGEARI